MLSTDTSSPINTTRSKLSTRSKFNPSSPFNTRSKFSTRSKFNTSSPFNTRSKLSTRSKFNPSSKVNTQSKFSTRGKFNTRSKRNRKLVGELKSLSQLIEINNDSHMAPQAPPLLGTGFQMRAKK
jgi:hypothetical protein